MDKNNSTDRSEFRTLRTAADILGQHGKSDEEIMEFLEYHFPISSAIMQKIMESRKSKRK